MRERKKDRQIKDLGHILLRIGLMLMSTGASTARIRMTVDRIANFCGYNSDLFITHRALTLNLSDKNNEHTFSSLKRTSTQGVNFRIVSGISRMSWKVKEQNWTLNQIEDELNRLAALPRYPKVLLLPLMGLAGASFCGLAGGSPSAMGISFLSTLSGFIIKEETQKLKFNTYLCVLFAAITSAMFSGLFCKLYPDKGFQPALATSVLYLIPGVPLINSFTDLIDGNLLNGMLRAVHGLIIAFMIALGLVCALSIYKI